MPSELFSGYFKTGSWFLTQTQLFIDTNFPAGYLCCNLWFLFLREHPPSEIFNSKHQQHLNHTKTKWLEIFSNLLRDDLVLNRGSTLLPSLKCKAAMRARFSAVFVGRRWKSRCKNFYLDRSDAKCGKENHKSCDNNKKCDRNSKVDLVIVWCNKLNFLSVGTDAESIFKYPFGLVRPSTSSVVSCAMKFISSDISSPNKTWDVLCGDESHLRTKTVQIGWSSDRLCGFYLFLEDWPLNLEVFYRLHKAVLRL